MRLTVVAALAALLLTGCSLTPENGTPQPTARPETGRLPDVTLPALGGGQPIDLGSFQGPAVVNLWASNCPPCERELPIYAAFARKYDGTVKVLGIDYVEPRKTKALRMMRAAGVAYPVAYDFDGEARAIALPKLLLLDADGTIAYEEYLEIKDLAQLEDLVAKHLGIRR